MQSLPAANQEQAKAVAEIAKALVEAASAEKSNKTILQISDEGLEQAAQTLAGVMPSVAASPRPKTRLSWLFRPILSKIVANPT